MEQLSMFPGVKEIRDEMMKKAKDGTACPCCGRYVKIYERKLHSEMVIWLIGLYHLCGWGDGFYTTVDILRRSRHLRAGGTNGTLLVHWGLIEKIPDDNRSGAPAGSYRITSLGRDFLFGIENVHSHVKLFNGELIGQGGDMVCVRDCIDGKFDYNELMGK